MKIGAFTFAELHPDPHTGIRVDATTRVRDVIHQARVAEDAGLAVFGIGEHHRADFAAASPAVLLAAVAAATHSIRLTSAVTVLSSADPVSVFNDFTALDLVSGGRAEIMVGRGAFTESFPLFGLPLEDYEALFEEKIDLLLQLRSQERVTWSGRFRPALVDQPVFPRPVQQPLPVWVGTGGTPASSIRAGRLGLPIALAIIGGSPRRMSRLVEAYREAIVSAGHAPSQSEVAITSHTFVARTSQGAADTFYPYYAAYLRDVFQGRTSIDRATFETARSPDGALFVGSPAQIIDKIGHFRELFGHQRMLAQISLGSVPQHVTLEALELLGSEVAQAPAISDDNGWPQLHQAEVA